jgi:flagellar hook protein FlgE
MALTSTLFTGLSGLDTNQTRLNVVGNNISNVNTVAFKSSRALFKPQFYVTDSGGTPPSGDFGGANPSQRGLGSVVAAIEKDFSPGSIEPTGKVTDLAIDGEGFFIVQSSGAQKFTRDGSFTMNSSNELVTTAGDFVQGFGVDENNNIIPGELENIIIPIGTSTSAQATQNVKLEGNLNADGTVASGASIFTTQDMTRISNGAAPVAGTLLTDLASASAPATQLITVGDVYTLSGQKGGRDLADATFTVGAGSTVQDLMTFFDQGMGIFTQGAGVDQVPDDGNAATPVPGSSVVAIDANTSRIAIAGNLGAENVLNMTAASFKTASGGAPFDFVEGTDGAGIESNAVGESVNTSFVVYDSLGTPLTVSLTAVLEAKADTGNTWRVFATSADDTDTQLALGSGTVVFDNEGKLLSSTGTTINLNRTDTGAETPLSVGLDFGSMTSLTSGDSELIMTEQDGSAIGTLDTFSIGANGIITGSFTNGLTRTLGQVALASFNNNQGLVDLGGNMYVSGPNSGVPVIATPLTLGSGSIRSGALELSNVDLSEEFINLIISSTGFTASSRVISTSDQLLTALLNSSR